tara:strand:+ start:761 stop:1147 length:387 start_codon:yes stop_codon:yes gene_type:complete
MIWKFLGTLLAVILLVGPGALLLIRFFRGRRFPWWILILLSIVIGWGVMIGASLCTTKDLAIQMEAYESRGDPVPDELMDDWASDAHGAFAVVLGWAVSAFILGLWLIVYGIAHLIRKALVKEPPVES